MQDYQTARMDDQEHHDRQNPSSGTSPQAEPMKRIRRSRNERLIAGVAGGLAHRFQIDPLLVRLGFLLLALLNGLGFLVYAILWLLIPNEDSQAEDSRTQMRENLEEVRSSFQQLVSWIRSLFR